MLRQTLRLPSASLILLCSLIAASTQAADFEVRSPLIDVHEFEYDTKFARGFDRRNSISKGQSLVSEFEYGVNAWWSPAIEGEWGKRLGANEPMSFDGFTIENRFQLAEHKAFWLDLGLFVEIERGRSGSPNAVRTGPLLRKDFGRLISLLNVVAVKESGVAARRRTAVAYAFQSKWALSDDFQPGLEIYGGAIETGASTPHQHLGGPAVFGVFNVGERQDFRYEVGYLFGLNSQAPRGTVKFLLGYEYRF